MLSTAEGRMEKICVCHVAAKSSTQGLRVRCHSMGHTVLKEDRHGSRYSAPAHE